MKRTFIVHPNNYVRASQTLESADNLREQVRMYIMDDTHRKEDFADQEINTEDDNYEVNDIISEYLKRFSPADCRAFLDAIDDPDFSIVSGGWVDSLGYHIPD